jgi:hypothetical protein
MDLNGRTLLGFGVEVSGYRYLSCSHNVSEVLTHTWELSVIVGVVGTEMLGFGFRSDR